MRSHSASAVQTGPPPAVEERDDEQVVCVDVVVDAVGEPLEKDTAHELFARHRTGIRSESEYALESSPDLVDQGLLEPRPGGIAALGLRRAALVSLTANAASVAAGFVLRAASVNV